MKLVLGLSFRLPLDFISMQSPALESGPGPEDGQRYTHANTQQQGVPL